MQYCIMYRIAHEPYDPHASFSAQVEFDLTDGGRCYEYPLLIYLSGIDKGDNSNIAIN